MVASKSLRQKIFRGLRDLMGTRPLPDTPSSDVLGFDLLLRKPRPDDRSVVMMLAALLDQAIETALMQKFIPMQQEEIRQLFMDDSAPLFSFDSKIRIAFALGIIGPAARADLVCIKNVRNAFAHSRKMISFDTLQVAAAYDVLTLPVRAPNFVSPSPGILDKFISVGYEYALHLICYGDPPSPITILILDLPPLPPESQ
jgi:hypothetical protein